MSADLNDAESIMRTLWFDVEKQFIEGMMGTFDEDPYRRKAKYEQVPLSKKKLAKLEAAEDLLRRHGARLEENFDTTREKRTWLETKEEYQNRLATLPERRVDWVRQQLAEGKRPAKMAYFYDEDVIAATRRDDGTGMVSFPIHRRDS